MKRFVSILLSALLLLSTFSVFAAPVEVATGDGVLVYEKITKGNNMMLSILYTSGGKLIWSHASEFIPYAMVDSISDCYINGDTVYYVAGETLYALDLLTGKQLWSTDGCGTQEIIFDQWDNIYTCAYDGINLTVLNPDGVCLYQDNSDDYYRVFDLRIKNDTLIIYSEEDAKGVFIDDPDGIPYYSRSMDIHRFQPISVLVDGKAVSFDRKPFLQNQRTLVPLRAIFEALGADVFWIEDTQTVAATRDNTNISLQIGHDQLFVNGKAITLDTSAQLVGDRTFVPVRAISEAFDCEVDWDDASYTVTIQSK